jgi:hypothetical protein
VHGDALAERDVADDRLAFDRAATARAVDHHVVHAFDRDAVFAEPERALDDFADLLQARGLRRLRLGELFGRQEAREDRARREFAVADGREHVVHFRDAVVGQEAGEFVVVENLLGLELEARGLLLENLAPDLDRLDALLLGQPVADFVARARGDGEVQPVAARAVARRRQNLDDFAVLDLVLERDDAVVDLRARTLVADFGVNRVGEVNRRRAARELNHLAFGREGVDLFRVQIKLEARDELARVGLLLPLDEVAQPLERLVFARVLELALFVLPVRGDALFGDAVHLLGADLHLERLPLVADDRGVQRLIQVLARRGDEVFDAARHGVPVLVNDAERGVAVAHVLGDDADRGEVVDLVERDLLPLQLEVNAVEPLDAPFDADDGDALLVEVARDARFDLFEERVGGRAAALDGGLELLVIVRLLIFESQVFEFSADLTHAEAVGDGRVHVERLLRDALALFGREVLQRPHVVQPVGEFDDDDADVVHHRQDHLADVLGLRVLLRDFAEVADLGHAVHEVRDFGAEVLVDVFGRGQGVFDDVVQEAGADRDDVHLHLGQNPGDRERVDEVRLARLAHLILVLAGRKDVSPPQQIKVGVRVVLLHRPVDILEANHRGEL